MMIQMRVILKDWDRFRNKLYKLFLNRLTYLTYPRMVAVLVAADRTIIRDNLIKFKIETTKMRMKTIGVSRKKNCRIQNKSKKK